jgi:putative peptidoglycan lipid II flippase
MIVFAAFIAPHFAEPGVTLAIGVFVAGLVQLGFQLPYMLQLGLLRRPRWNWGHEGVRRIGRLMLPAIFGSSVSQVALLLDTLIASFLATGSIAWLYYADRLVEFPLGVFSIALATVILPGLAAHHAAQSPERFASTLDWAIKLTTIVVLPATVALLLLAGPLTVVIFHYGRFDEQDVRMSTLALMAYSIGLMGFSMVKVLAPGYFARQDTRTPVRIGIRSLLLGISLNLVIVLPLAFLYPGKPGLHALLALNTGIGAWFNATMLYLGLRRQHVLHHSEGWRRTLWQVLAGNLLMGVFLWYVAGDTDRWLAMDAWQRVGWMTLLVAGGAGIYFGTLYLLGMRVQHLRHQRIAVPPRPGEPSP